jgi:putative peptidoglycan lipid II flippase
MSTLMKAGIITVILSLILKLSGFLRESIIAMEFGASAENDGYIIAFSIITLIVIMTTDGFNSVFLPLFIKDKNKNEKVSIKNANGILNYTIIFMLLLSIISYFLVPYLIPLIFGNMSQGTELVAVRLTKFFVLFLSVITVNGMLESYLQSYRSFIPTQVSRLLATLTGAFFAYFFSSFWGIDSLAYGFIVGVLLGIMIQIINLKKLGYKWELTLSIEKDFRNSFLSLFIPAVLSAVVGQINVTVNRIFASGTFEGAVTYLNNASLIVSIPTAIFGTTIVAIIFTLLSENVGEKKKFQDTVFFGFQLMTLVLIPLTFGLIVVGQAVIGFIYERGAFTLEDTKMTYDAMLAYLPLIYSQGLQMIVLKALYAKGKTALIFKLSIVTIICNVIANYFLVNSMGYLGPAIASSIIAIISLVLSAIEMYKDFDKEELYKSIRMFVRILLPSAIMAVGVWFLYTSVGKYLDSYLWILVTHGLAGIIFYILLLRFLYKEGFNKLLELVPKKLLKLLKK